MFAVCYVDGLEPLPSCAISSYPYFSFDNPSKQTIFSLTMDCPQFLGDLFNHLRIDDFNVYCTCELSCSTLLVGKVHSLSLVVADLLTTHHVISV
jgi:hypothetical protein